MKKYMSIAGTIVILVFLLLGYSQIIATVEKGTYQVKQAAVTGKMSAKMTPGMWMKLFGDITEWPKADTFYFTHDDLEGARYDQSIEVRFNDGSKCNISGTCRIMLPVTEQDAINLVTVRGHKAYKDMEMKLILPTIRNALRLTANLMSARESYSEKRTDFNFWAFDQIQNGLYQTTENVKKVKDLISGEMVTKTFKVIKTNQDGSPLHEKNPLDGTGIRIVNFEIKSFEYEEKVKAQIAKQQEALMAVATAKAKAQEAEQAKLTIEAEGKAAVAKAKYEEEQIKVRAVVKAEREKEVQVIAGQQRKEVARLDKEAAALTKEKEIYLGQGEAERKRLVLAADGALKQKLLTYENVMSMWADAYSKRQVPSVVMGGEGKGTGTSGNPIDFQQVLSLMALKQIGLDLTVPKGSTSR